MCLNVMLNFTIHGYQRARGNSGKSSKVGRSAMLYHWWKKVIFYQSISNDHKPWRALMLYYCLIQTNLKSTREVENG